MAAEALGAAPPKAAQSAECGDRDLIPLTPPRPIPVPKRVVRVTGADWPGGIYVRIVQQLLDVVHELALRICQLERLEFGGSAQHGRPVRRTDRGRDVPEEATRHALEL